MSRGIFRAVCHTLIAILKAITNYRYVDLKDSGLLL